MKTYDCFLYNGEEQLLRARMEYLRDVVDEFVLIESPLTFRGKVKPIYGDYIAWPFPGPVRIITNAIRSDIPPRINEDAQRDAAMQVIGRLQPEDIVVLGDVDEIPSLYAIRKFVKNCCKEPLLLMQRFYYYYLNCEIVSPSPWPGTVICKAGDVYSPSDLRNRRGEIPHSTELGGWHYSCTGGPAEIARKLGSYCHSEFDTDYWKDQSRIAACMESGTDLLERPEYVLRFVEYDGEITPWPGAIHAPTNN